MHVMHSCDTPVANTCLVFSFLQAVMTKAAAAHRKAGVEALLRRPYGALQLEQYERAVQCLVSSCISLKEVFHD